MKFAIFSVALSGVAVAAALAAAPAASADPESDFLATLTQGGFSWPDDATAQSLVDLGYGVCSDFDSGANAADLITDGVASTGWDGTTVGYFIGAATSSFCPEHLQQALEEAQALGG